MFMRKWKTFRIGKSTPSTVCWLDQSWKFKRVLLNGTPESLHLRRFNLGN